MDLDMNGGNKRVFQRLGGGSNLPTTDSNQKVCFHWRAGRCNRYPCPYLHRELPAPAPLAASSSTNKRVADESGFAGPSHRRGPGFSGTANSWGRFGGNRTVTKTEKLCKFWVDGNCPYGDKCRYLHCWSKGDSFSLLTQLDGHQKVCSCWSSYKWCWTLVLVGSDVDGIFGSHVLTRLSLGLLCHQDPISFTRPVKMKLWGYGIVLLDRFWFTASCSCHIFYCSLLEFRSIAVVKTFYGYLSLLG